MFIVMGTQGRREERRSQRERTIQVLLNKVPHGLCHFLMALCGGDFVLIEKIKVLVVEKWLGMEVKNTGFATRLPRFKFSLCHVCTSYN